MTITINRTMQGRAVRADQRGIYADVPGVEVTTDLFTAGEAGVIAQPRVIDAFKGVSLSGATVRRRLASSAGVPFQFSRSYFPSEVVDAAPQIGKEDTGAGGFLSRLEDAGWKLSHAVTLAYTTAAEPVAGSLAVEEGTSLAVELWTVTDAETGKVLAVTESLYPAALVSFSYA
jgi:DNA-binding GntR family transcriptional regulator